MRVAVFAASFALSPLHAAETENPETLRDAVAALPVSAAPAIAFASRAPLPPKPPLSPESAIRLALDEVWSRFREALSPRGKDQKPAPIILAIQDARAGFTAVEPRIDAELRGEEEKAPLIRILTRYRRLLDIIEPSAASAEGSRAERLTLILRLLDGLGKSEERRLAAFAKQVRDLDRARAGDPAVLLELFEGGTGGAPVSMNFPAVDARGLSSVGKIVPDTYPRPGVGVSVEGAAVPSPSEAADLFARAAAPETGDEPDLWERLAESVKAGAEPFANMTSVGRRLSFEAQRQAARGELLFAGNAALAASGEKAPGTLDAVDAAMSLLKRRILYKHKLDGAPKDAAERLERSRVLREESPEAALYFARRGLYQMFVHKGLASDSVAMGTHFSSWELGLDGGKETGAVLTRIEEAGAGFTGLKREYEDGSTRFEAVAGGKALSIVTAPGEGVEMRSLVEMDAEGKPSKERTTVFTLERRRKVRESLRDYSQALLRMTEYKDDGVAVKWIQTWNTVTGARIFEDREAGTRIASDKDGKNAVVVPIGRESGAWRQEGRVDDKGRFVIERLIQKDGVKIDFLSEHVMRVEKNGQSQGLEVRLDDLHAGVKGRERERLSKKIAQEIIAAFGWEDKDEWRSRPLHNYLFDTWTKDKRNLSLRMSVDARGDFQLVYSYADGTKRIEQSKYAWATPIYSSEYKNKPRSLMVLRPTHTDRQGRGTLDPRRWREYLSNGGYNHFHSQFGTEDSGWFSNAKSVEYPSVHRYAWSGDFDNGGWTHRAKREFPKIETEAPGTSTFGIIGGAIHDTPVVGHVLKGGEWVGKSLYTGLVAAPPTIIYAITGDTDYGVEMSGSWTKNPAMNLLVSDEEHLAKMDGDMWFVVLVSARENREKDLAGMGYTDALTDWQEKQKLMNQWRGDEYASRAECEKFHSSKVCDRYMYSIEERMRAVRGYGALTWGDRVIEGAQDKEGAAFYAQNAAGWGLKVFENVGETMFNPVIWATFGVGKGVQALTALRAAGTGARFLPAAAVPAALSTARVTHTVLASTLYATWGVSGIDNLGQTIVAIKDGDNEKAWKKAADFSTDLFFVWMMAREARSQKAKGQAGEALLQEKTLLSKELKAAESAVRAKKTRVRPAMPETAAPEAPRLLFSEGRTAPTRGKGAPAVEIRSQPSRPGQGLVDTAPRARTITLAEGRVRSGVEMGPRGEPTALVQGNLALKPRVAAEARPLQVVDARPSSKPSARPEARVINFAEAKAKLGAESRPAARPVEIADGRANGKTAAKADSRIINFEEARARLAAETRPGARGVELAEAKAVAQAPAISKGRVARFFEGILESRQSTALRERVAKLFESKAAKEAKTEGRARTVELADAKAKTGVKTDARSRTVELADAKAKARVETEARSRTVELADAKAKARVETEARSRTVELADAKTVAQAPAVSKGRVARFFEGILESRQSTALRERVAKLFESKAAKQAKTEGRARTVELADAKAKARVETDARSRTVELAEAKAKTGVKTDSRSRIVELADAKAKARTK
ncbi:MAG: hypothetical protein COR54_19025, partial [Elusimicrobia bacterium CG22_combo_CG10-13_8_21_14_all_63_91]